MTKKAKKPDGDQGRSILINFVLDKSGSMDVIRQATISGFNEFKNDQTAEAGDAFFTLTLFDTRFTTVCEAVPIREVPDLDRTTYEPGGMTALFDAIGHTMRITDEFVAKHHPDQVLFVIMTDGEENSSREFDREKIFRMIEDRQNNAEYEFMYLGANQDSYAAGTMIGVRPQRMANYAYSEVGSAEAMMRASHNVSAYRRHGTRMRDEFFSPEMEALGQIPPDQWAAMSEDEREKLLGEDKDDPGTKN
jgi:hypothetical protein